MLPVCVETIIDKLTDKRKFIIRNKYILLSYPLFSMIIYSDKMKEKMSQIVANIQFCCSYIKTEVVEIYENSRVIQYLLNILGSLIFSPQSAKSRAITHV